MGGKGLAVPGAHREGRVFVARDPPIWVAVLVRGVVCLVYSDNERDPDVLNRGSSPACRLRVAR